MKITESYEGAERILPVGAVAELVKLNRDYLDLLVANAGDVAGLLPPRVLQKLKEASAESREAMAACRYALFVLEAPQSDPSGATHAPSVHDPVPGHYGRGILEGGAWPAFTMDALSFAWQLCRQNPLSARVMLGLSGRDAAAMAATDPWTLRGTALRQKTPMRPRWSDNPCFWPDLLSSAGTRDALKLDLARLLGVQLLAADLHASRAGSERRA